MKRPVPYISTVILAALLAVTTQANWPQFRGNNGSGLAPGPAPVNFGPGTNELWKLEVGTGHSSPCAAGDVIYLTSCDTTAKTLSVLAVGRATGQLLWRQTIKPGTFEQARHPSFNVASSSPATDGERVVAYFGSYGLLCFDTQGNKQWELKLPPAKSFSGNAVSPIIAGDRVILYRANYLDHFLLAVDKVTGKTLWKKPQAGQFSGDQACTATPVVKDGLVIVHGMRSVRAFSLESGEPVWQSHCKTSGTSSPIIVGNEVIVGTWNQTGEPALVPVFPSFAQLIENHDSDMDGRISPRELPKLMYFHRAAGTEAPMNGHPLRFKDADSDKNQAIDADEWNRLLTRTADSRKRNVPHGLVAIPVASKGVLKAEQLRYLARRDIPEVPSPIVHQGRVYLIKNGGVLTCIDLKSGERLYRLRTGATGTHYASPVIAGNRLYIAAGNGEVTVLDLSGEKAEVVASNDMGDGTFATPAIVDGVLYIRTHTTLYAFGE